MAFYVGQEVEYIGGYSAKSMRPSLAFPPSKTTLIVSWVIQYPEGQVIEVQGYPCPDHPLWKRGWSSRVFKPVQRRSTDISIFTAMLGPKQKETIDG